MKQLIPGPTTHTLQSQGYLSPVPPKGINLVKTCYNTNYTSVHSMVTAHVLRYINGLGQVLHPCLPSQFTNLSPGLVLSLNTDLSQMLPQHLLNQVRYYPNTSLTRTLVHSSLSVLSSQYRLSQDRCYPHTFLTKTLVLPSLNLVFPQHRLFQDSSTPEPQPSVTPTQAFSRLQLKTHLVCLSWCEAGTASPHDRLPIPAYMGCHPKSLLKFYRGIVVFGVSVPFTPPFLKFKH